MGLDLPEDRVPAPAPGAPKFVDDIWQRAQALALAGGAGPGDAMMQALADAADARWERRHGGGPTGSSDTGLFDI